MKDKVTIGVITGLLADIAKLIFNYLAFRLHFTSMVFWQIAAVRFLGKQELFKPISYFIGAVTDLTVAAIIGVVFIYFLHFTGRDSIWLKGTGFALVVWVIVLGTLLTQSQAKLALNSSDIIVTFVAHVIYGISLSFASVKLYRVPTRPE